MGTIRFFTGYGSEAEKQAMKMADYQPFSKLTSHTAEQAYDKVLEYAGASLRRDVIDQRIVREVKNGTYTYIGSKPEEDGKAKQPGIIDTVSDTEGYIKGEVVESFYRYGW